MSATETHDTATELESLHEALGGIERSRERVAAAAPAGFDPAALFLLDLRWDNLFERAERDGIDWWCKGCRQVVKFSQREKHHAAHKRAFAKRGELAYRATRQRAGQAHDEGGTEMAVATRTRSSRPRAEAKPDPKPSQKNGAAKKADAAKPAAKKANGGARAEAGKVVKLAADLLKGKKPMTATELAKLVVEKHGKDVTGDGKDKKLFNAAFAIRQAARKGETFKTSDERPAKFSLK